MRSTKRCNNGSVKPQVAEFKLLIERSLLELNTKMEAHDAVLGIGAARWDLDQDQGTIAFETKTGTRVVCSAQIIGTLNLQDGTLLWAWDHPSILPRLRDHAEHLRQYGQKRGIERLVTRKISCTESQAWEFTALACKLCNAQGGYVASSGMVRIYMTLDNIIVTSPKQKRPNSRRRKTR
jgi:hypothetical protein